MRRPERECVRKKRMGENQNVVSRQDDGNRQGEVLSTRSSRKYPRTNRHVAPVPAPNAGDLSSFLQAGPANALLSDVAKVKNNLRIFSMLYLQARQQNLTRPDLNAMSKMRNMDAVLFQKKQVGNLPGVNVGDHFFSRAEMASLGLHFHHMAGIDYIGVSAESENYVVPSAVTLLPLATSIVMSGGYEDDVDNADEVIYTGQGGNNFNADRKQVKDQKMEKGNLSLKNCIKTGTAVRVFRGHDLKQSYTGRVFTYDGLYKVVDYWAERGISGFLVYKFKLKRCEGQPVLTTDQVRFCNSKVPQSPAHLTGLVCEDVSNGLEPVPVPASNTFDPPAAPDGFRYTTRVEISGIPIPPTAKGCSCVGSCTDATKCSCAKLNGNTFPYVNIDGGRLAVPLDVVYECGPNCGCGPDCLNRSSQRGLQYRLEVYKTPNKGWAVRSWDTIFAGAPVCEYYGKLVKSEGLEIENDVYIFDLDCLQTMRGIDGRQRRWGDTTKFLDDQKGVVRAAPVAGQANEVGHAEFCLDGSECGGVARFINHCCEPNLFIQCVLSWHHDIRMPRIVLFAAENIEPLQELTYDYGYQINQVFDLNGQVKQMPCYCGALACRKRLY